MASTYGFATIANSTTIVPITYVTDVSTNTTTSTTYANLTGMTATPTAGTYLVIFNGHATTSGASAGGFFSLALAGTTVADSVREISANLVLLGGLVTVSLNTIGSSMTSISKITVTGSQAVTAQFKSSSGGTINVQEKNMTFIRVA